MTQSSGKRIVAETARPARQADPELLGKVRELLRILSHEKNRGCRDDAVIGGLGKYLSRWKESLGPSTSSSLAVNQALGIIAMLEDYSVRSPAERELVLATAVSGLSELASADDHGAVHSKTLGPAISPELTTPLSKASNSKETPSGHARVPSTSDSKQRSPSQGTTSSSEVLRAPDKTLSSGRSGKASSSGVGRVLPRNDAPTVSSGVLGLAVTAMKGVNTATASKLGRLGVQTAKDLLYFFPRRHNDFSSMKRIADLVPGAEETIMATIWEVSAKRYGRSGRPGVEVIVGDESGNMRVVFFNQPYLAKALRPNTQVVLSGRVELFRGQRVFESPQYENLESDDLVHTGRIVPVYPLTEGLYQRSVRRIIKSAVDRWASSLVDHLPDVVKKRTHLIELSYAISQIHYPDSHDMLNKAKERLAFDELFGIQLGALTVRRKWRTSQPGHAMAVDDRLVDLFVSSLPFGLTRAQHRAMKDILGDQASPDAMTRLLQGEVGSGKTVVAAVALLVAVANGFQGVLMAPTEILSEQHFRTLTRLYENLAAIAKSDHSLTVCPIPRVLLLTGSSRKSEKDAIHKAVAAGEVDVIVGTHAIIQEGVAFKRLGLAIVDEQHRFGVLQRSAVRQKGYNPDVLVMTATPIPRTLALTLYGDLDLTVIDELPPGRQEIRTKWLQAEERYRAYDFIRRQVKEGRQAFIICPLVEESDKIEAKAATAEYERLSKEVFPDLKVGLLHGRMKPAEKDSVMQQFGSSSLDVLVSTTVVEVGIDVPNASVMLIEGADRFGLSQLHQLRGRVGRGAQQSYCILLADSPSSEGRERLAIIEKTQNGFELAEEDMRLRGPGEFLGTRQSGLPDLKVAKLSDIRLIELARQEALNLFDDDPDLAKPENRLLAKYVAEAWHQNSDVS